MNSTNENDVPTCAKCGRIAREREVWCRDCISTDKHIAQAIAEAEYLIAEGIREGYIKGEDGRYWGTDKLRRDFAAGLFGREGCEMSIKQTSDWIAEKFSDRLKQMSKRQGKKVVKKIVHDVKDCKCGILQPENPEQRGR